MASLFAAARASQNHIAKLLVSNKADIISGTTTIRYHRDCHNMLCSNHHIVQFATRVEPGGDKSVCIYPIKV